MVGTIEGGIVSRRLFGKPISIVLSSSGSGGESIARYAAGGGEVESGTKPVDAEK